MSGDQARINRIHSRKKLHKYKKVIPVTGDRGIVLVLRGEFGLAKKPRSTSGCPSVNHTELIFKSDDFHAFLPKSISWNHFEEYDSSPEKVKDTVLCRLANEPSYEYNTAFAEYRYNKNQKIKEYLKKNSKEIIQWLIGLSDEKRLIYFLQSGLVPRNAVGQIVDEILNSNLENKSVIAAYALNGQKTEQKEENIAFAL